MENELGSDGSLVLVLNSMGDAVIATDTEGKVKLMNPAAEALTGWTQQDALDRDVTEVFQIAHEDTGLLVESPGNKTLRKGMAISLARHILLTVRGGMGIPVTGSAAPIRDSSGNIVGVVWVLHDNTEHKQAQRVLQETFKKVERAKREWESAVDALPDLVCLVDEQGHLIRANRTVETWNLRRVAEVNGRGLHALVHPKCANSTCYLDLLLKQVVEKAIHQLTQQEAFDPILKRHILVSICPVLPQNGEAAWAAVVVMQDITVRKQAEEEQSKLIEDLDAFAHTVAHDLRNPVGLITGFAELEQSYDIASLDDLQHALDIIVRIGHKMNNIIDELLLLAGVRKTEVKTVPLDMARIVAEAQQRLVDLFGEYQAEVIVPDASAWPKALGYGPWVEEVWVNYLSNGLKYGGRPPRLGLGGNVQPDGMVRFWVRDNGPGLSREEQVRLFAPFTRLGQARITGHGLGLSIVRRIVEKLGGQVGVESSGVSDQGSVFYFTLPPAMPGSMDKRGTP
jgi:PAS domain S-box-containing protein